MIASPICDTQGRPERLLVISRDITEQKAAEIALRESSETFRLACRSTSDAVRDWNLQSDTMSWGGSPETLFGYASSDIVPDSLWWKERIHKEDRALVRANFQSFLASDRDEWSSEYRFRRADGSYAEILDRGYVLRDGAGNAIRVVGAMVDLTDRKHAEAKAKALNDRLTSVLESTTDSVAVFDRDWRFTYINMRAREQVADGRDLRGQCVWDVFPPLATTKLADACRTTMQTGEPTCTEQFLTPIKM